MESIPLRTADRNGVRGKETDRVNHLLHLGREDKCFYGHDIHTLVSILSNWPLAIDGFSQTVFLSSLCVISVLVSVHYCAATLFNFNTHVSDCPRTLSVRLFKQKRGKNITQAPVRLMSGNRWDTMSCNGHC